MTYTVEKLVEVARKAIQASSKESSVYIGCDSIRFPKRIYGTNKKYVLKWFARYSVVVIVHKDSAHGCELHYATVEMEDWGNLKQRLMSEVHLAVQVASEMLDHLDGRYMEVHLDVNPSPTHKSNVAVKEALGYVRGMGMNAVIKPDGFAATHAADHAVRGKRLH